MAQRRSTKPGKGVNKRNPPPSSPETPHRRRPGPSKLSHSRLVDDHPPSDGLESLVIDSELEIIGKSTQALLDGINEMNRRVLPLEADSATRLIKEMKRRQDLANIGQPEDQ